MPKARFTKAVVEQFALATSGQLLVRDTQLPGFGLRIGTRAKTYFAEGQVDRRTVRATIGRADIVSLELARKKAISLLGQMADGIDPNRVGKKTSCRETTLRTAFDAFFLAKPHLGRHTVAGYGRTRDLYLRDWSERPIHGLTRQMILARHRKLSDERGAVTANSVMRHLRSVYNFTAATHDGLPPNPVGILTQAHAWHTERRRRSVLLSHQFPVWWDAVSKEAEDARDILLMALFTGMRRGEIVALKWEFIDFVSQTLSLPTTKNGDPLDLPLSSFVYELLSARREHVGQNEWVFPSRSKTGHITETKSFTRRVVATSETSFSMHDLRRTFITVAESLDVPTYTLKRLLNHRTADVTGGYIVISADRLRAPVEQIASKILELAHVRKPF